MDTYTNTIHSIIKENEEKGSEIFVPFGPVCGNGDIVLTAQAESDDFTVNIYKSDFRKFSYQCENGEIKKIGTLRIGGLDIENCFIEQKMKEGVLRCVFGKSEIVIFVSPDNLIFTEITAEQKDAFPSFSPEAAEEDGGSVFTCRDRGLVWYLKKFDGRNIKTQTAAALCCRRMPSELSEGIKKVRFCISAVTNFDSENYSAKCIEKAVNSDYEESLKKTNRFWNEFFNKSQVTIPEKEIEKLYNGSLYLAGCCMDSKKRSFNGCEIFLRAGETDSAPDIKIQPYYGVFASNHPELADSFIEDAAGDKAEEALKGFNPVIFAMRYRYGVSREYLENKIYPYLKRTGELYKKYLVKEKGKYIIKAQGAEDIFSISEREKNGDNNTALLGLYKLVYKSLSEISEDLNKKSEREEYKEIYTCLSPYPLCIKRGKKCFKVSEKNSGIKKSPYVLKHIFPASDSFLPFDKKLLKICRNTYFLRDRRFDDTEAADYHICGARLKVKPEFLTEGLTKNIEKKIMENMIYNGRSGAAAYFSLITGTVNEMLLQSYDGVIRIFPCFNKENNASFKNLRAEGGFLVSAGIKGGKLTEYKIKSLYGGKCRAEVSENVKISVQAKNGKKVKFKKKDRIIEFYTEAGEEYILFQMKKI